jgi:hypothetical protein
MNLLLLAAIVAGVAGVSVALMFVVHRRRAPGTRFFVEVEKGTGVFTFIGTAFAVLLAFVVLEAFSSFNDARSGAESEATSVVELSRTSEFFAPADRARFVGRLICYGRAVVTSEWPAMQRGERSPLVQDWVKEMGQSLRQMEVRTPNQEAAFLELLDQESIRVEGRRERLSESIRALPAPVWFILGLGAALTIGFPLLFADRRESFLVEGSLIAAIAALVTAGLLLVWFLDHPYDNQSGSIKPIEMTISVGIVEDEQQDVVPPCNSAGEPSPE